MPTKTRRKKTTTVRWSDSFYLKTYKLASAGMANQDIASQLGVSPGTFKRWQSERPALAEALAEARKSPEPTGYVHDRLPAECERVYDQLKKADKRREPIEVIEAILSGNGVETRKKIFLQVLVDRNYNTSYACSFVNITQRQLTNWIKSDSDFAETISEMEWHKNNLYESELISSVKHGDVASITFANKTRNRDRGYALKKEIEHTGTIQHQHVIPLSQLKIPVDVLKSMLAQLRSYQNKNLVGE